MEMSKEKSYRIEIKGLVQGVGFRPFIYRLATRYKFEGSVENRNDGVVVLLSCTGKEMSQFVDCIREEAPPASKIESITFDETESNTFDGFTIVKSRSVSDSITDVSPDIAVCDDCLEDMKIQRNRIDYPFVNCTNCGPRFTIIKDLPYDREKTTMKEFTMCESCRREYTDINDRRFHAQPVACAECGPVYTLYGKGYKITGQGRIIEESARLIEEGGIVAIKGLGGFFLACDPFSENTVRKLRELKNREGKPFAVMARDMEAVRKIAYADAAEEKLLLSLQRPIVLLRDRRKMAPSVNPGVDTTGVMLPYMPLHYLLFERLNIDTIVLTSGNITDEPIITDNSGAVEILGKVSDAVVTYNRDIHNRADDSVVSVINKRERVFRRSRGYAPVPVKVPLDVEGVLATGAELSGCFCIGRGNQAILSQHIGDLQNAGTFQFFTETVEKYKKLFRVKPTHIVTDMHPDYLSTRYSDLYELPVYRVQHHHAHIASCMAENGLDQKVIGVAMDGTGYGDDGRIWGSEFLVCNLEGYERAAHFGYMPMPGGDKVTAEPWRMALALLYEIYGESFTGLKLPFLRDIETEKVKLLCRAIDQGINTPLTSGSGRLFDAVSALTGLCTESRFHAEAPMRLEAVIDKNETGMYRFGRNGKLISFKPAIEMIVEDIKNGVPVSRISAMFHNTVTKAVVDTVKSISNRSGITDVVLSGGTFQNRHLSVNTERTLRDEGFRIYSHSSVPMNDGGIALGQLIVGAALRR